MEENISNSITITRNKLYGISATIVMVVALFGAIYHLYNVGFGAQSELQLRSMHWAFISFIAYLTYPIRLSSKARKPSFF